MIDVLGLTLLVLVATAIFLGIVALIVYEVRVIVRGGRQIASPPPPPFFPDTWPAVDPNRDHTIRRGGGG
ncbi:MAG TPA: hypothetical protein VFA46_10115 [Actinomycetes bacterium]|jgi:hypothetical protein|nr:hypothetical protein [Actinomycetes bacterium]